MRFRQRRQSDTNSEPVQQTGGSASLRTRLGQKLRWIGKTLALITLTAACGIVIATCFLWYAYPFPFNRLARWPVSPRVTARDGTPLLQIVGSDSQWRRPVALDDVAETMIQATLAAEDKRFWSHAGVDVVSVLRAAWQNLRSGRIVSGASTITMQTCRMVDERPRTYWAKAIEAVRALQLERRWSKRDILQAYLNLAPYGGNIRGVEAASERYFNKKARDLSLREASILAGLPQAPNRYRPDAFPSAAVSRGDYVLNRMLELDLITRQQREWAAAEPMRIVSRRAPPPASHAAWLALSRRPQGGKTTIDLNRQRRLVSLIDAYRSILPSDCDIAAVVLDIQTSAIRALVGSADPLDPVDGQINGAVARRSPGSALKPFVYAAAFETRRLGPESLVEDYPIERAGWSPENFDRRFSGSVTAAAALRRSLNVPAILVAEAIGLPRCLNTIKAAGIPLPNDTAQRGGLSVVVGTVEVTLLDLVNAYATLGRRGRFRPIKLFVDQSTTSIPVLQPNVCAMINDILSSRNRVPTGLEHMTAEATPWFMWKTGTSSGRRDAWAVGHNGRFAIGVWVGKFSGSGRTEFVGKTAAEPLLARLFCDTVFRQDTVPDVPKPWPIRWPLTFQHDSIGPTIISPRDGDVFVALHGKAIIHTRSRAGGDADWFLNDRFIGNAPPERFELTPGTHELRCVDDHGRHTAVQFRVEPPNRFQLASQ